MHGVNLDLLRTLPHHPDGRPKDPHAHHRVELTAQARAARLTLWRARLTRLQGFFAHHSAPAAKPCPDQPS